MRNLPLYQILGPVMAHESNCGPTLVWMNGGLISSATSHWSFLTRTQLTRKCSNRSQSPRGWWPNVIRRDLPHLFVFICFFKSEFRLSDELMKFNNIFEWLSNTSQYIIYWFHSLKTAFKTLCFASRFFLAAPECTFFFSDMPVDLQKANIWFEEALSITGTSRQLVCHWWDDACFFWLTPKKISKGTMTIPPFLKWLQ